MSYHKSEANRQAVLDYLNKYPGGRKMGAIADALSMRRDTVRSSLVAMLLRGEVDKIGHGQATIYSAIATTTVSAKQVIEEAKIKKQRETKPEPKMRESKPWLTRHIGGDNKPIKNQGGQGSIGPRAKSGMYGAEGW